MKFTESASFGVGCFHDIPPRNRRILLFRNASLDRVDIAELFDSSPNPYVIIDPNLIIIGMNRAYLHVTMREREDIVGRNIFDAFPSDPEEESGRALRQSFARVLETRAVDEIPLIRYAIANPDGTLDDRYWSATHTPLLAADGSVTFILQHTVDVTELHLLRQAAKSASSMQIEGKVFKRAQALEMANQVLQEEHSRLRDLFEMTPSFMALLVGPTHIFQLANSAYLNLVGQRDVVGRRVADALPEVVAQGFAALLDRVFTTGEPFVGRAVEVQLKATPQQPSESRFLDFVYQPIRAPDGAVTGIFVQGHDITEQKRAEHALQSLNATLEQQVEERTRSLRLNEEQLRQAQKMEAVGQLTGGVAHDFNNLLQIVCGNLETLQRNLPHEQARLRRAADHAMTGARRAASLTQRLLAFSRKQPLDPKPVDINTLVGGMSELVHRTLGETIAIETVLSAGLWRVEVDSNQLESTLLNLAVNARDAMITGGKLTIETANAHIDDNYTSAHVEVAPGQYVVICVSDTGTGMDAATMQRVFEPFFTTKDPGKGTGLGLSQVYGFVKQSGGHVKLYSEIGEGTTVKVYLPRYHGPGAIEETIVDEALPEGEAEETILVVEDDDDVRTYSVEIFRELGYNVLEAQDGPTALTILSSAPRVDLLFSDIVLPGGMTGADVSAKATLLRPALKVLFTTGYARNAIVHHGRLDPGVQLITKPFSFGDLAKKVRDILDRE
ncbi:MAG: histidine kinase [Hyphomicrobiales bacterium]|nr:histidine kinase [Hyphomicrobiales bacterium]